MKLFFSILIIFIVSCSSKSDKSNKLFIQKYNKAIHSYKNSIYKACKVDEKMKNIFKSRKLLPIFRIESDFLLHKNYCYSVWVLKDHKNDLFIYFSLIDKFKDYYRNQGEYLYRNKKLNKEKSVKTSYLTMRLKKIKERKHKKDYFHKEVKKGVLSIYSYKLKKEEVKLFNIKIGKIKKDAKSYQSDMLSETEEAPSMKYVTFNRFKTLKYKDYLFKHSFGIDLNEEGFKMKKLVDYIFELSGRDK